MTLVKFKILFKLFKFNIKRIWNYQWERENWVRKK